MIYNTPEIEQWRIFFEFIRWNFTELCYEFMSQVILFLQCKNLRKMPYFSFVKFIYQHMELTDYCISRYFLLLFLQLFLYQHYQFLSPKVSTWNWNCIFGKAIRTVYFLLLLFGTINLRKLSNYNTIIVQEKIFIGTGIWDCIYMVPNKPSSYNGYVARKYVWSRSFPHT